VLLLVYGFQKCRFLFSCTRLAANSCSNCRLSTKLSSGQSESHITTGDQSVSHSWCQAPSWARNQIFVTVRQLRFRLCGASSLTRIRVCHLLRSKSVLNAIYIYNFTCRHSTVSCQESGCLWVPTVYSFTPNSNIHMYSMYNIYKACISLGLVQQTMPWIM
jgi:hypothetical protein